MTTGSGPSARRSHSGGSLVVVGTGFQPLGDLTVAAESSILGADVVCYVVSNPLTAQWIQSSAKSAIDLRRAYETGRPRIESYQEMVDIILREVRSGKQVCAAFYGHPGVFVNPSHAAIRAAASEGFRARMLPGISAEDYLYADLAIDPSTTGCQSYEATDFIIRPRIFDPHSLLILWQVGVIGHFDFQEQGYSNSALPLLRELLVRSYPVDHEIILYRAADLPIDDPDIVRLRLGQLAHAQPTAVHTLVVPAVHQASLDEAAVGHLRLVVDQLCRA